MNLTIGSDEALSFQDGELERLLWSVYVKGGFTTETEAKILFKASAVRQRGHIIGARQTGSSTLSGMIIVVPSSSPASRFAQDSESELHLLAVSESCRNAGLGTRLVNEAVQQARSLGSSKILLWTQSSMTAAQSLYRACGFVATPQLNFENNGRQFLRYQKSLD